MTRDLALGLPSSLARRGRPQFHVVIWGMMCSRPGGGTWLSWAFSSQPSSRAPSACDFLQAEPIQGHSARMRMRMRVEDGGVRRGGGTLRSPPSLPRPSREVVI